MVLTKAQAYAQEETSIDTTPTPTATATPTPVDYKLAYPGLLPDNPLYKLKVLRDKIVLQFITDPMRKIDFYLLQTDKGILAANMLVDKNEIALAGQTALKAENNYTLLTNELPNLPKKPDAAFFNKLQTASLKHQEILNGIIAKVQPKDQDVFKTVLNFSKTNWQSVERYQQKRTIEE